LRDEYGVPESGSIPIAAAVSQLSWLEHRKDPSSPMVASFWVRRAQKAYGTRKAIEGRIASRAVIIDDVITSGASALAALRRVREEGFGCGTVMFLVFRGTEEDRRSIEGECRLEYVFRVDELAGLIGEQAARDDVPENQAQGGPGLQAHAGENGHAAPHRPNKS